LSTDPPPAGTAQPAGGAENAHAAHPATSGGAGQSAISLADLTRHFGERTVLRDVSVEVPSGATLAVLGPNGAGKTTLLRILATLLRPHGGTAVLLGEELPRRGWAVRGRIGLLGHEPLLYRDLTGRENLRYHARLHGVGGERVEQLLEAVQMGRRADEPLRLLSRGMVQRLAICRAVLHAPEVLLLDEPRSNLDPAAAALVEPLIGAGAGGTRVLTSHDPSSALADADVVLALRDGHPAYVGPPGGLDPPALRELYT
jgi:heme exporter protein A